MHDKLALCDPRVFCGIRFCAGERVLLFLSSKVYRDLVDVFFSAGSRPDDDVNKERTELWKREMCEVMNGPFRFTNWVLDMVMKLDD